MKIENFGMQERSGTVGGDRPRVVIATQLRKEREMLDKAGNVIDPRTKQIIKRANEKEE